MQEKLLETHKKVLIAAKKVKGTANESLSLIDFEKSSQYKHILEETRSNKEMVQSKEKLNATLKDYNKARNLMPLLHKICNNSLYSILLEDKAKQMLEECISEYHNIDSLIADIEKTYEDIIALETVAAEHDNSIEEENNTHLAITEQYDNIAKPELTGGVSPDYSLFEHSYN